MFNLARTRRVSKSCVSSQTKNLKKFEVISLKTMRDFYTYSAYNYKFTLGLGQGRFNKRQ